MISRLAKLRGEREEGFTLIELLVVIIIIGILAAIAIPVFLNQRARAQDAATTSAVKSYVTALESYSTSNPNAIFPASGAELKTILQGEGARASQGITIRIAPINSAPNNYMSSYTVCGYNPNGKRYVDDGTETTERAGLVYSSTSGGLQTTPQSCGGLRITH